MPVVQAVYTPPKSDEAGTANTAKFKNLLTAETQESDEDKEHLTQPDVNPPNTETEVPEPAIDEMPPIIFYGGTDNNNDGGTDNNNDGGTDNINDGGTDNNNDGGTDNNNDEDEDPPPPPPPPPPH